jgi:uncharacterized protein YaaR (DUF327 family)
VGRHGPTAEERKAAQEVLDKYAKQVQEWVLAVQRMVRARKKLDMYKVDPQVTKRRLVRVVEDELCQVLNQVLSKERKKREEQ